MRTLKKSVFQPVYWKSCMQIELQRTWMLFRWVGGDRHTWGSLKVQYTFYSDLFCPFDCLHIWFNSKWRLECIKLFLVCSNRLINTLHNIFKIICQKCGQVCKAISVRCAMPLLSFKSGSINALIKQEVDELFEPFMLTHQVSCHEVLK